MTVHDMTKDPQVRIKVPANTPTFWGMLHLCILLNSIWGGAPDITVKLLSGPVTFSLNHSSVMNFYSRRYSSATI